MTSALEISFKSQIRKLAREKRVDPAELWQNLVLERFLVRLSQSKFAPHFILKGGVLLSHYLTLDRHTRDLDFSIHGLDNRIEILKDALLGVTQIPMDDGFQFRALTVEKLLHPHMRYPGVRARMWSHFGKTRFQVIVDMGFGDLVTPSLKTLRLTQGSKGPLLEDEVKFSCYPIEFIFAEKLESIIYRGGNNSRMKDFHDLLALVQSGNLDPDKAEKIVKTVFSHRQTDQDLPLFFTVEELSRLQEFWKTHLRGLPQGHSMPTSLKDVIDQINGWIEEHMKSPIAASSTF